MQYINCQVVCAAVSGRVSEVGEAGQSIVTGTGERLNVKWAAGVEEVDYDQDIRRLTHLTFIMIRLSWWRAALPALWRG